MKNFGLISYTVLLLCLQTTINSQLVCPTFYRNENQQGDSFQMCLSGDVPENWNDQALSFYVPSGYSVQLYEGPGFSGENLGLYSQGSYNTPTNGYLSSVIVSPTQNQTQISIQACPTFYRNKNQQGDSFQMCWSGDVPNEWNEQASSFYIPAGYLVILYEDSGYNGQSIGPFGEGSSNLPVNFIGELSSVIVSQPQPQPQVQAQTQLQNQKSTPNCPTFYRNDFQQGDSFQMCSSGDVPGEWNDQASSFYVPFGYSVQLYQDSGFSGLNLGSYILGSYNVPDNGQLSSVIISSELNQTQPSIPNCPTFYRNQNQQGDSFQMCSSGDVPDQWNDQASSFYVPSDYFVELYQDFGFSGENLGSYTKGSYNVPTNGQLSSVAISSKLNQTRVCPVFFTYSNQQGDSFQMCSNGDVPFQWNDKVSSLYVPTGFTVLLYQDSGFGGFNFGSYNQGSYNVPADYDNQLSSVIISQNQAPKQLSVCPTFYSDISQQGKSIQFCTSGNIPSELSNQVSSFYVPAGFAVQLFQGSDYGGQSIGSYVGGSYDVPNNFNDQVSSVKISQDQSLNITIPLAVQAKPLAQSKPAARNCPRFYTGIDQGGDSFKLCSSGDIPRSYNDQISSFYVPPGYYVRLYPKRKYGGRNFGTYTQGSYNVPSNFNNQLSSVLIRRR